MIETVHPDGSRERYEYPDPNQTLLTAEYPIRIQDARQGVKQLSWNIYGQLISYTDCSRRSTRYHYDSDGQLVSVERANGESTRYQRNSYQQIEQVFYADGSGEHYQYDDKGRVAVITPLDSRRSPLTKHRIELRYDLSGRIVARLHAQTALQFAYDPAGRLIVLINENQAVSRFDWSVMDQLVKEVGFDGRTQHYHYNDLGLLVGHDDGGGEHWHHSHYSYDDQDRLSRHQWDSQQNDNLFEQRFFWDEHGHLLHAQQFLGQGEQAQLQTECAFEYDLLGRLVGETQRIWQADAQLAHPELLHEYSLKHELDELGFRERSQLPFAGEVAYMRYGSGHVQGILYNQQSLLDIRRDTLHREVERRWVLTGRPESRELDIAPYGIEAKTALSRHQLWDNLGRLQQREYHGLKIADDICTEVNAGDSLDPLINLQKRQYQYDPLGQLVKIHQPRQSQYYAYDLHGRLTAARLGEQGALVQHWQFDWAGNPLPPINTHQPKPQDWSERVMQRWQDSRFNLLGEGERPVSEQVAYWPDNRVFYSADAEYQYDAQGSRIRKTQSGGETHYYYYNDLNQLQRVDCYKKDHGLLRSLYRYDPLGRRLFKQVDRYRPDRPNEIIDSEVEFYGWDGDRLAFRKAAENQWHLIYEPESFTPLLQLQQPVGASANEQDVFMMQMTSALQETLEYLPSHEAYQLARAAREQAIFQLKTNEQWQSPELPEKFYFYHCNHMGLPEALTNRHGDILWWATYDAWGNMLEEYNPQDIDQPIRLLGQYHDRETGLYYNRHRYYDPKLGNYINQDPIGLASGEPNLAVYPRNPVQGVDPLGLEEAHQGFMGPWSETRADGNPAGYGCGDSKTDWIVPDRIMGADYFPACRKHDKCYEDLEKTKAQCDLEFKVNLVNTCDNELADKGIRRSLCKGVANIYYKAVDVMGNSAFEAAQGKSTSEREMYFLDLLKDKGVYVDEGYYKEIDAKIVAGM